MAAGQIGKPVFVLAEKKETEQKTGHQRSEKQVLKQRWGAFPGLVHMLFQGSSEENTNKHKDGQC